MPVNEAHFGKLHFELFEEIRIEVKITQISNNVTNYLVFGTCTISSIS